MYSTREKRKPDKVLRSIYAAVKIMDKNIVELEGNVTRDVELKGDGKYCFVNIAVGRSRSGGADFVSAKAFGDIAKACAESLQKGDRVTILGFVSSSSFTPKDSTEKVYRTDIVIDTIRKISKTTGNELGGFIDESKAVASV